MSNGVQDMRQPAAVEDEIAPDLPNSEQDSKEQPGHDNQNDADQNDSDPSNVDVEAAHPKPKKKFEAQLHLLILDSMTLTSGLLVLATFPVVTMNLEDASSKKLSYFTAKTVQDMAAITIGLFIIGIGMAQALKFQFRFMENQTKPAFTGYKNLTKVFGKKLLESYYYEYVPWMWVLLLGVVLLTATLLFALVIAAFVGTVGLVFAGIAGFFLGCTALLLDMLFNVFYLASVAVFMKHMMAYIKKTHTIFGRHDNDNVAVPEERNAVVADEEKATRCHATETD